MKRYVVLDRDGTIIVERHYLSQVEQVELLPNAAEGLRLMQEMGLGLVIVTNQAGVARGYLTEARLHEIHERLFDLLAQHHITVEHIFYCIHHPDDNCDCRKPKPGMVQQAAAQLGFDLEGAFVIGDKASDTDMGIAIGGTTFLVNTGYGAQHKNSARYHYMVEDLLEASHIIKSIINGEEPNRIV